MVDQDFKTFKSETSPPFLYKIADQEGFERVMAEIKLVSMHFYIQIILKKSKISIIHLYSCVEWTLANVLK